MANVGSGDSGKTYIGAGNGRSGTFASIGTNSGLTAFGVVASAGMGAFSSITPSSTVGIPLISGGLAANPTFGTAVVPGGGTGRTTLQNHGVLIGAGSTSISATSAGSAGQIFQSGGGSADPTYSTATYPSTAGTSGNFLKSDGTNWSSQNLGTSGTFSPTILGTSTAGTTTYSNQFGYYTKIGDLVSLFMKVGCSSATGTGNLQLGAFPFTVKNQTGHQPVGANALTANATWPWPAATTMMSCLSNVNATTAQFFGFETPSVGAGAFWTMGTGTLLMYVSLNYQT